MAETAKRRITVEWLHSQEAWRTQIERFSAEWGESAEINPENLRRLFDFGFSAQWLGGRLLKGQELIEYDRAVRSLWMGYISAIRSLWNDYERDVEMLWVNHKTAVNIERATYEWATDLQGTDYPCLISQLLAEFDLDIQSFRTEHHRAIRALKANYDQGVKDVLGKMLFGPDVWAPVEDRGANP